MGYEFNAKKVKEDLIEWLRKWYDKNGYGADFVIGISGGKDSSVAAALIAEAFCMGKIIGVMMPNGVQSDIDKAQLLCKHLGIKSITLNIEKAYNAVKDNIQTELGNWGIDATYNAPPRLRMLHLYAVAQSLPNGGRVVNTCNLSEDWVGYSTRWGDSVGDVAPLSLLTVTEVKELGYELGLPKELIEKVPSDGLCGQTDEEKLGFTYAELDRFIREGIPTADDKMQKINRLHERNKFKMKDIPRFCPYLPIVPEDDVFTTNGLIP